jgi:hypothetical protein
MAGTRSLSYLQLGKEVTKGTAVAATRLLSSDISGSFAVDWGYTFHEGRAVSTHAPISYGTRQFERVDIAFRTPDDTGIAFNELPFFITQPAGSTAGAAAGTANAYAWTGSWGGTADGSAISYTIEFGDDVQEYEAEYCQMMRLRMGGGADNMTTLSADLFGRQATKSTKTALAGLDEVRIPAYLWVPKFATSGGGLAAATSYVNFLREWEADWTTGLMRHHYASGVDYFGQATESGRVEGTIRLVVDSNSTAITQFYDKGEAGTKDFLRLQATGGTITNSGTAYTAILEFGLFYENVTALGGEIDGQNTYEIEARIAYDSTWGKAAGATAVNTLATLSV